MGYCVHWEQMPFTDISYHNVFKVVLAVVQVKFRSEPWGFVVGDDENNSLAIERYPTQITGTKTDRLPYTKDVMKTLIVMAEFGVAKNLDHDDNNMTWFLEALDEVHAVRPLVSYEMQKTYFKNLAIRKTNNV